MLIFKIFHQNYGFLLFYLSVSKLPGEALRIDWPRQEGFKLIRSFEQKKIRRDAKKDVFINQQTLLIRVVIKNTSFKSLSKKTSLSDIS